MGLDWCVRDKVIEGQEANLMMADAQLAKLNKERNRLFEGYCKSTGTEIPAMYPNPVTEEWFKTQAAKEVLSKTKSWETARDVCVINPMQTLGAPKIGESEEADKWARDYYNEILEGPGKDRLLELYKTADDYLMANQGKYVSGLAKNKGGLVGPSGICVGAESFRGKCLAYVNWLPMNLKEEAYEDHTPEELILYGERLLEEAEGFEASKLNHLTGQERVSGKQDLELVRQAATWCGFWGKEGHAMHAWF